MPTDSTVPASRYFPAHLKPYAHLINNTGGWDIEELLTEFHTSKNLMRTNIVVFTLGSMVHAQVALLADLYNAGLLRPADEPVLPDGR